MPVRPQVHVRQQVQVPPPGARRPAAQVGGGEIVGTRGEGTARARFAHREPAAGRPRGPGDGQAAAGARSLGGATAARRGAGHALRARAGRGALGLRRRQPAPQAGAPAHAEPLVRPAPAAHARRARGVRARGRRALGRHRRRAGRLAVLVRGRAAALGGAAPHALPPGRHLPRGAGGRGHGRLPRRGGRAAHVRHHPHALPPQRGRAAPPALSAPGPGEGRMRREGRLWIMLGFRGKPRFSIQTESRTRVRRFSAGTERSRYRDAGVLSDSKLRVLGRPNRSVLRSPVPTAD